MARNNVYDNVDRLSLPVPVGTVSGDFVLVLGDLPAVAQIDRKSDGNATVQLRGVFKLSVTGEDGSGNAAVAYGDKIYHDTDTLNADDANGVFFGRAMGAVGSGESAEIWVLIGV